MLSQFGGDKKAWPVYMTIGNIKKEIRRSSKAQANVLIGYLPTSKLEVFKSSTRGVARWRVFHACMRRILEPLIQAGKQGVVMTCVDGHERMIFPILAAYVADYPEQCLVTCTTAGRCPKCMVRHEDLGENITSSKRDRNRVVRVLQGHKDGYARPSDMKREGLRPIHEPFWIDLPHCNIFTTITPDILHQLHKGVFKDHFVEWCLQIAGGDEIDERFKRIPTYPGLRHFKKGISNISQWTGKEMKHMQSVLGCLLAGAVPERVMKVAHALLDFIYLAQFRCHTSESLDSMQQALDEFHNNKDVFVSEGIRTHLNIPKIHSMAHYIEMIRSHGSADGYNTEISERLHIDYAKNAYRASNKRDYVPQMTDWLQRQESVLRFNRFVAWSMEKKNPAGLDTVVDNRGAAVDVEEVATPTHGRLDSSSCAANSAFYSGPDHSRSSYHLAQKATHPNASVSTITLNYKAPQFLSALMAYLSASRPVGLVVKPNERDRFDLYTQLTIRLPLDLAIDNDKAVIRMRATPGLPQKPGSPGRLEHFDTVFISVDKSQSNDTFSGMYSHSKLSTLLLLRTAYCETLQACVLHGLK
jgi:Plavaka transposase